MGNLASQIEILIHTNFFDSVVWPRFLRRIEIIPFWRLSLQQIHRMESHVVKGSKPEYNLETDRLSFSGTCLLFENILLKGQF